MRSCRAIAALGFCLILAGEALADGTSVEQCVRSALERAPTLRAASAETAGANAGVALGRSAYWPTISGHGEYGKAKGYDEAVTNGGSTQAVVRIETKNGVAKFREKVVIADTSRVGSLLVTPI